MQPFCNAIMTDEGARLFMRAQAGEIKIQFTKIAVGDGSYSEDERKISNLQGMAELKSQRNEYFVSNIEVVLDHSVKVTALITNYDPESEISLVEEGYYINEMGLFAKEHDGEAEVLYSIAVVAGEYGDFMPPYNGVNPAQIIQEYYATVSNAEEVTIQMGKGAIALIEDLKKIEIPDFDDSGEVDGIESFTDFMEKFVKGMSIYQFFSNLKAGLKYVLHVGQLVNNCATDNPDLPLAAAQGKFLMDQITQLYSEMQNLQNDLSALDTRVTNAITDGDLAAPYTFDLGITGYSDVKSGLDQSYITQKRMAIGREEYGDTGYIFRYYSNTFTVPKKCKIKTNFSRYNLNAASGEASITVTLYVMDPSSTHYSVNILNKAVNFNGTDTLDLSSVAERKVKFALGMVRKGGNNYATTGITINSLIVTNQ